MVSFGKAKPKTKKKKKNRPFKYSKLHTKNDRNRDMYKSNIYIIIDICYVVYIYIEFLIGPSMVSNRDERR